MYILKTAKGEQCGQWAFFNDGLYCKKIVYCKKHKDFLQENIHIIVLNSLADTFLKQILLGLDKIV